MLQPLSSWHLLLFLFITSSSLADWSLDSPYGGAGGLDESASQLRLDKNPIVSNTVTDDFSTSGTDGGGLNLAQVPQVGNIGGLPADLGIDPPAFKVASPCSRPSPGKKRRRVRRDECSAGDMFKNIPSQFKEPAKPRKEQTPTANPGSNTPPSANASPRKFIPVLDPEAKHLSRIFLPDHLRPSEDDYTCRKEGYYIPVCAQGSSELLGRTSGDAFVNFLDPCFPCKSFCFLFYPFHSSAPKHHNNRMFLLYLCGCMNPESVQILTNTQLPDS